MMMKILLFLTAVLLLSGACRDGRQAERLPYKVLYVGDEPGRELPPRNFVNGAGIAESRYAADVKERMPSFVGLLERWFVRVKAVDARDYREEMTREFDVVIFDALPKPVVPGVKTKLKKPIDMSLLKEEQRQKLMNAVDTKEVMSARYFSDSYNKPTVFVGDKAGIMGAAIGLKLDWYCRCLDAHAYQVEDKHPIFQEPLPVELVYDERIAPTSALFGVEGVDVPAVMPMWRVQTEGYHEGGREHYRQGLVAFGDGFTDSPDAERICGGVSDKNREAVAIGRHGNFLMWGFAADPAHMTEAAQRVFVNAVCYIAGFNGQPPVARKYCKGCVSRERLRRQRRLFDAATYEKYVEQTRQYNQKLTTLKQEAEELQAAGKPVPADLTVQARPALRPVKEREAFLKGLIAGDMLRLGCRKTEDYRRWLDENTDYAYGGKGDFSFSVDEDLKALGIPVGDIKSLEAAIGLLEGPSADRGRRILQRYTLENYASAVEWRQWLEDVRERLFFTEACRYKFIENGRKTQVNSPVASGGWQQENPVQVSLHAVPGEIRVRFTIKPGFHIYTITGETGAYIPTQLKFHYPAGVRPAGALVAPEGKAYEANLEIRIYEGMVEFRQPVEGTADEGRVACTVTYQACDETICLPPMTEELETKIEK